MPKGKTDLALVFGEPSGGGGMGGGSMPMGEDPGMEDETGPTFDELSARVFPDADPGDVRALLEAFFDERETER